MCSLSVHGSRRSCHGNAGALLQPALPLLWRRIVPGAAWGSNYGDLPSPLFSPPPRAFMHVPFGESFPPHLSSLLVSPLLSGGFPTQQYKQAAGRGGGMGADGRRACSQDWDTARPTPPEATPWTRLSSAPLFEEREREVPSFILFSSPPCLYPSFPLSLLLRFVFSLSPSFF